MTLFDWTQAAADLAAVRAENEIEISIRRGNSILGPQLVRIARVGGRSLIVSGLAPGGGGSPTQEIRGRVVVMGGTDLDIQPEDRFNDAAGVLYRVMSVRPNRRAAVTAEAEVIQ